MFATKGLTRITAVAVLSIVSTMPFAISSASAATAESGSRPRFSLKVVAPRIDDAIIGKVQNGMTKVDVESLVGSPNGSARFPRSNTHTWDYDYQDAWGYQAQFSVHFNTEGLVVGKTNVRLHDGG